MSTCFTILNFVEHYLVPFCLLNKSRDSADEELAALTVEYMNLCSSNLEKSRQLEVLKHEIKGVQEKISECQLDLLSKKTNSEANLGPNSDEIVK